MTKEESLSITSHIGAIIAQSAPALSFSPQELKQARAEYSEEKLEELQKEGYYFGDFEHFYTMLRFCDLASLWGNVDEEYLKKLFFLSRKMSASSFREDPYLKHIKIRDQKIDSVFLTTAFYEKGEFFQYAMPDLSDRIVVPKIGFFPRKVVFPAVYEGNVPWVSVCPSEISSMSPDVDSAFGRVMVLGLGLGYYPYRLGENKKVESITVVEKNPHIISLFREQILPQFPHKKKIRVVQADAFDFLAETENGAFDFCYADIWEGWVDGAAAYEKILPHERRLWDCTFRYWIGDEILWYRKNVLNF